MTQPHDTTRQILNENIRVEAALRRRLRESEAENRRLLAENKRLRAALRMLAQEP